jgi:stage III sporulation protein AA
VGSFLVNVKGLRELRLRNGKGVKVNIDGKWFWLGKNKLLTISQGAMAFDEICDDFIKKACNQSVYAYEKMLAQGYFTLSDGSRVGVCGIQGADGVFQKYTSLCVRTAHYFACVANDFDDCVIVAGLPGSGKTTYLRDLACKLSVQNNVVVVDERGEISSCCGFELLSNCDVFKYGNRQYAFEVAVRTMSPDWIVCDEIFERDMPHIRRIIESGVKVAASIHAKDIYGLRCLTGSDFCKFSYAVFLTKDTFEQKVVDLRNYNITNEKCYNSGEDVTKSAVCKVL